MMQFSCGEDGVSRVKEWVMPITGIFTQLDQRKWELMTKEGEFDFVGVVDVNAAHESHDIGSKKQHLVLVYPTPKQIDHVKGHLQRALAKIKSTLLVGDLQALDKCHMDLFGWWVAQLPTEASELDMEQPKSQVTWYPPNKTINLVYHIKKRMSDARKIEWMMQRDPNICCPLEFCEIWVELIRESFHGRKGDDNAKAACLALYQIHFGHAMGFEQLPSKTQGDINRLFGKHVQQEKLCWMCGDAMTNPKNIDSTFVRQVIEVFDCCAQCVKGGRATMPTAEKRKAAAQEIANKRLKK